MSTRIANSAVLEYPIDRVWGLIRPLNFSWSQTVQNVFVESQETHHKTSLSSAALQQVAQLSEQKESKTAVASTTATDKATAQAKSDEAALAQVNSIRTVTYQDKTVQKVQLLELSDARHEVSWQLIDSVPATSVMSSQHSIRLSPITTDNSTFIEWSTVFSKDANIDVLEDSKYKQLENFNYLRRSLQPQAILLDGVAISARVRKQIAEEVKEIKQKDGQSPKLVVVIVGDRPDSLSYVRNKTKMCQEAGMDSELISLQASTTQAQLLEIIEKLNKDSKVNGVLVQLPLPSHINSDVVINSIDPKKDVDGLTIHNAGMLSKYGIKAPLIACTPLGLIEMCDSANIPMEGKHVVVVGRSDLVGKPAQLLFLSRNATVTVCHSHTKNRAEIVKQADILVVAIGKANYIQAEWLKKGVTILDVGMNSVTDKTKKLGYRYVGDVDFERAKRVAKAITPVPGGVGPMTVAMLLRNTLRAYGLQRKST